MPARFAVVMLGNGSEAWKGCTDAVCAPLYDGVCERCGHSNIAAMISWPGRGNLGLIFREKWHYKSRGLIEMQFFMGQPLALTACQSGAWVPRYSHFGG